MVLQNYSWQDFLVFAALLLVVWYLVLWWFYKGRDAGGKAQDTEPLAHSWQDQVDELSSGEEGVMGAAKPDRGLSVVAADEFGFAAADPAEGKQEKLGLIPDVQQEIKSICTMLAENDGTKEDFFSMFSMLVIEQYPQVPTQYRDALGAFIREHVPFHLSAQELENLWG